MRKFKTGRFRVTKTVAEFALLWCRFKYGPSIWVDSDIIKVSFNRNLDACAQYKIKGRTSYIYINHRTKMHKSMSDLADSIIHEYTHHLQPTENESDIRNKLETGEILEKYDYLADPCEIEAAFVAERDRDECVAWIKLRLKRH